MSAPKKSRLVREVEAMLKATGRPWRTEHGAKHWKFFIGETLVGITSFADDNHNTKKIAASIRKACKQ